MSRVSLSTPTSTETSNTAEKKEEKKEEKKVAATTHETTTVARFSSGSTLLDLVLGGGWPLGKVVNVVGDRSSGKTLLAIEACANFIRHGGLVNDIRYVETEAALDEQFARVLGLPDELEPVHDVRTAEDFFNDVKTFLAQRVENNRPSLYIIDSLDAMSDADEMERDISAGSYKTGKAKILSEAFRRLIVEVEQANCCLFIISQTRDAIGVLFGEKKKRSGGQALDFYASIILWLYEKGKIESRTINTIKRIIGVDIRAKTKKNKTAPPYRECEMELIFGYGVDDEKSILEWLKEIKVDSEIGGYNSMLKTLKEARDAQNYEVLDNLKLILEMVAKQKWTEIEEAIAPKITKYR